MTTPQHYRHFWGAWNSNVFTFWWDIIKHDSFVVITASEGPGYDVQAAPQRFVGDAGFIVGSVAPFDGGVKVWVIMTGGSSGSLSSLWSHPLNLWTDITVFDPADPWGQN